jgi:glyoxalase family protein
MNDARPRPLEPTPSLHHITAICSDAQSNADFYTGVLGLRLLKRTVNYDDPSTYHLYYGEPGGTPGTILTFFPWPDGNPGRHGIGQAEVIAFAVPMTAMGRWIEQFLRNGVSFQPPVARRAENGMTERVIAFKDPDGLQLELVGVADQHADKSGTISDEYAIRGFYGVTLWLGEALMLPAWLEPLRAEIMATMPAIELP